MIHLYHFVLKHWKKKKRTLSTYTLWTTLSFNYTFFFLYKVCLYCKSGSSHTRIVSQWLCFFSAFLQNPLNRNRFNIKTQHGCYETCHSMKCSPPSLVKMNLNTVIWVETSACDFEEKSSWCLRIIWFIRLYMITHT